MLALLLGLLLAPPEPVVRLAFGRLEHVCQRESRCRAVGLHEADAHRGARAYGMARRAGWLDPTRCRWHRRGDPRRWSTRGAGGTMAAFTMRHLPCLPPEVLDHPLVAAIATHRRAAHPDCDRHPACRRWRDKGARS